MSKPLPQFQTTAFVLLLAVFSYVHSLQRRSSSDQQESRQDLVDQNGKGFLQKANNQKLVSYKENESQKLLSFTEKETMLDVNKAVTDKPASSTTLHVKERGSEQSLSETRSKKHSGKSDTQKNINSFVSRQDNFVSRLDSFSNITTSAPSESTRSEDLDTQEDALSHLENKGNNLWSTSSTKIESNSEDSNEHPAGPSSHSDCTTCRMRQIDKQYRILNFKQQILNTLQMRTLPNTTGVPIPKVPALTHLYDIGSDMMSDSPRGRTEAYGNHHHHRHLEYEDDFVIKTERVFTPGKPAPIGHQLNSTDIVYFPPSLQLFTSKIKATHLWIYIKRQDTPPAFVTVERVLPESLPAHRIISKKIFSQKLTNEKAFGWKRIDMRDTLRHWIRHPMSNLGLLMRADDNTGTNLIVLPPSSDTDKGYEPWLDTRVIEPRSNSRRRRSESLICVENSTDSRCCRHPLLVGFAEFGWDWIIAPTHVKADYCTGECRMTMQDNTPYSWVNQQTPGSNSCCTPTKLSPLPLLYFDESMNIVYQILQNMKVDKCGCA